MSRLYISNAKVINIFKKQKKFLQCNSLINRNLLIFLHAVFYRLLFCPNDFWQLQGQLITVQILYKRKLLKNHINNVCDRIKRFCDEGKVAVISLF